MPVEPDTVSLLVKVLPQIAIIAAISSAIGWSLRGAFAKPKPVKAAASNDNAPRDRSKNLEANLEKSKAAHKALKAELESLQSSSVPTAKFEQATADLDAARKALENESKRISAVETDLKRAQETIKNLNGRANDADKAQKERSFMLENELSKARQQLALAESRPDNTIELTAEIERLRESVAVSTRYAGEVRKREAAAVDALEKAQALLSQSGETPRPVASRKVGPVGDSDRVAAAKAEVLRLVEQNKQALVAPETTEVVAETTHVVAETTDVATEAAQVVAAPAPVVAEPAEVVAAAKEVVAETTQVVCETTQVVSSESESVPEVTEVIEAPSEEHAGEKKAPAADVLVLE